MRNNLDPLDRARIVGSVGYRFVVDMTAAAGPGRRGRCGYRTVKVTGT
ncbi:hypothetical protein ACPPVO_37080 [Dactylosporangium sp. McL0621]